MARILYVSQGYCTHDRRFLERLSAEGYEMWFLPCEELSVQRELAPAGSAVQWLPSLSDSEIGAGTSALPSAAERFGQIVRSVSPDLIHAGPVSTAGFLAACSGFHPLLVMSWGSDVLLFPDKGPDEKRIAEFALRSADLAIADCEAARKRIMELGGLRRDQIVSLPWGVDLAQFRPKVSALWLRRAFGWTECKVIISTRALEPVHRPLFLLNAIARVMKERRDVRLLMLGDGSMKKAVASFVENDNLRTKVCLAGQVPEGALPDYFAEAGLYVSATCCDGSSVSLLQAMACGLPVVAADGYGNSEWVKHRENGWLYPPEDVDGMAQTILNGLEDDSTRQRMGELNIQIAQTRADWRMNFPSVLAAYEDLLAGRRKMEVTNDVQLQNR